MAQVIRTRRTRHTRPLRQKEEVSSRRPGFQKREAIPMPSRGTCYIMYYDVIYIYRYYRYICIYINIHIYIYLFVYHQNLESPNVFQITSNNEVCKDCQMHEVYRTTVPHKRRKWLTVAPIGATSDFASSWSSSYLNDLPSGYVKIAIENCHL